MRAFSVVMASLLFSVFGCESDRSVDDVDHQGDNKPRVIGTDDYEHGVPDRTSTDRGVDQGGVSLPTDDQSRHDVSTMDRTFVEEAALGGLFEVRSAQLALEMQDDPQVKQIASMILEDHQKANQELEQIARGKGIAVPQELSPRYQEMLTQLQNAHTDAFASSFQGLQEKAHEDAIRLFERQAREGQYPELKSFAERTLPALRKHLDHIQQLNPPNEFNPNPDRA